MSTERSTDMDRMRRRNERGNAPAIFRILLAVLFALLPALAAAQGGPPPIAISYADSASANQRAAPGNAAPLPLSVINSSTFGGNVLWQISSDTTGGATLNGALSFVAPAPSGSTVPGPTVSLGLSEGSVVAAACSAAADPVSGAFVCNGTPLNFFVRSASLSAIGATDIFVEPSQVVSFSVQPLDGGATPFTNVPVTFAIVSGPAVAQSPTDTSSTFYTPASFTISVSAAAAGGAVITVSATRTDVANVPPVFFTATVNNRDLSKPPNSGDGQSGPTGQPAPQPLVVSATLNGDAQPGVSIAWNVVGGDASITSSTNPTDGGGLSSAQVLFGATPGVVTVQAQRTDVTPPVIETFTLTSTLVRTLSVVGGDGQSGTAGQTLASPLTVVARDNGQPVGGVTIFWAATNGATPSAESTVTGGDGTASVLITLGQSAGDVQVTAERADAAGVAAGFVLRSIAPQAPVLELVKPSADSGDGASGAPGAQLALTALALADQRPQAQVNVLWEVIAGDAQIAPASSSSDASGLARTRVTLGSTPGTVRVRASRADSPNSALVYTLNVQPTGTDLTLTPLSGGGQSGPAGTTLAPLRVRLARGGQPVGGATIEWSVAAGSATLGSSSTVTDANGESQVDITLGASPGPVSVRATSGGASALFALTVLAPETGTLELRLLSGSLQSGPTTTRADLPIVIQVVDQNDAPVSGVSIDWVVVSGGAVLDAPSSQTGSDGRSSMGFRFGANAGPVLIRARITGSTTSLQTADITGTAFIPTLTIVSGNNQSALVSTTLPQDFVVAIAAPASAAKTLEGVAIRWQVASGGGTLASTTTTTGADGRSSNRLTLGPNPGTNTVTASLNGGASVSFTATATVPVQIAPLTIVAGNNQAVPTRADSSQLVVQLRTTAGTPVEGATLVWSGTNAQLAEATTTTDENGRSTNTAQVLLPGAAQVRVELDDGSAANAVVFSITGGVANIARLDAPEETVGAAIDSLCPALARTAPSSLTIAQQDLLARCLELVNNAGSDPAQVQLALRQMQQDIALAQANAALLSASTQFSNVKTRIAALRGGKRGADLGGLALATSSGVMPLSFLPSAVVQAEGDAEGGSQATEIGADFSRWGFFASGIVGRGEQDRRAATPDFEFDTQGLTAGVDYRVNDQWIVGGSLGYNKQDTEVGNGRGGIDTTGWSASGYTTWYNAQSWYLDGVLTFGSNDYDIERHIAYEIAGATGTTRVDQRALASTGGDQLSMSVSFGRDFQSGAWNYGPYLRGNYTRVDFDSYAEELDAGAGTGLGLAVDARELKSMTGVLGGKVTYAMSRDWGILMPHAQLEWEHEFKDDPQSLVSRFIHDPTGSTIRVVGDDVDTDYYNIGFGLSALFPGGRSAFFYYEHLAGSEGLSQDNLSLGVRIEF